MYRHILIPTDGSELAERGVLHGLAMSALRPEADIWVAARWADGLIYLKTVSETRAQLTFGRPRHVQNSGG